MGQGFDLGLLSCQDWKINVCCLCPPLCGILYYIKYRDIWQNTRIGKNRRAWGEQQRCIFTASQVVLAVNNPPSNSRDIRDLGLMPGLGRSPRLGNGTPLQYSCQENPMDREAWWATVHGVTKSWTWLSIRAQHIFRLKQYQINWIYRLNCR